MNFLEILKYCIEISLAIIITPLFFVVFIIVIGTLFFSVRHIIKNIFRKDYKNDKNSKN